ncbi:hypothetical protein G9A89_000340 [Geosiphon pyriformis]|nr:hypothetical protein G9A89_000340 [Geosiphon pyriformis]
MCLIKEKYLYVCSCLSGTILYKRGHDLGTLSVPISPNGSTHINLPYGYEANIRNPNNGVRINTQWYLGIPYIRAQGVWYHESPFPAGGGGGGISKPTSMAITNHNKGSHNIHKSLQAKQESQAMMDPSMSKRERALIAISADHPYSRMRLIIKSTSPTYED